MASIGLEEVKPLARAAAERVRSRKAERQEQKRKIEEQGILATAGTEAAVRRAAHMTAAEGRTLTSQRSKDNDTDSGGRTLEAVLGFDDSDNVNFMVRGQLAARAVCRLAVNGQPVGTGFLVAPGILLTNNHVIGSAASAANFVAEFDYELDINEQPRVPIVRFALEPQRLFATSDAEQGLDFTFIAVRPDSVGGNADITSFGWIPMDARVDKILIGEPAIIIQHPRGEPKRVCVFSAELVDKLEDYLHYTTDTDHGASGSCVLNRSWQLVALHHASVPTDERKRGRPSIVNEGIRVSTILRALAQRAKVQGSADAVLRAIAEPSVIGDGRPQSGTARVATPVRVGGYRTEFERTSIRTQPADHFNRKREHFGYKANFLGLDVPLPELSNSLIEDAATDENGERELKYTHYSIVFSASRCLPIMTAVNINGAQSVRLARADREFEAADVWYYDPRIPKDIQLGPDVYDRTAFDYGHMVRREDPVWGDDNTARMANDDTFYMTNCTPQHHDLNTKTWQTLENAILDSARAQRRKVSVFTGPVLSPEDPLVLDVQVPTAFWKIVAYVEGGKLLAHGFMQWQTKLVEDLVVRESISGLEKASQYQVPIREIARLTGLDLHQLIAADTLDPKTRRRRVDESLIRDLMSANTKVTAATPHSTPTAAPDDAPLKGRESELREIARSLAQLQEQLARLLEQNGARPVASATQTDTRSVVS